MNCTWLGSDKCGKEEKIIQDLQWPILRTYYRLLQNGFLIKETLALTWTDKIQSWDLDTDICKESM